MECPVCNSSHVIKNGKTHNNKQNHICKDCGKQFINNPEKKAVPESKKELIDRLLLEKIPLAGIARAVEVSEKWLQDYVNEKYENISREIEYTEPLNKDTEIVIEADEMWSYVGKKESKEWIWIALEKKTRMVVGLFIGDRSGESAKKLIKSIPEKFINKKTKFYTDYWNSYKDAIDSEQHFAVGKDSGKTNHIERFNNTMRQRVSRLVRSTLSFSKKLKNHTGAIWNFVHHYNATRLAAIKS